MPYKQKYPHISLFNLFGKIIIARDFAFVKIIHPFFDCFSIKKFSSS